MCKGHDPVEIARRFEEPAVLARLIEHKSAFRGFVARRIRDEALVEDIVQDAFVKSLDKLGTIRDPEAAVAWFWRVLRNTMTDRYRALAAERKRTSEADASEVAAPQEETEGRPCACVHGAIDALKPEYATVLRQVQLGGMSVKDWAAKNGLTANNAGVRVFRARQALLKQVQRTCGSCAEGHCRDCTCCAA